MGRHLDHRPVDHPKALWYVFVSDGIVLVVVLLLVDGTVAVAAFADVRFV